MNESLSLPLSHLDQPACSPVTLIDTKINGHGSIGRAGTQSATINPVACQSAGAVNFRLERRKTSNIHECKSIHPGSEAPCSESGQKTAWKCPLMRAPCIRTNAKTALATQKLPLSTWHNKHSIDPFCGGARGSFGWLAVAGQFPVEPLAFGAIIMGVAMAEDNNLPGHHFYLSPPRFCSFSCFFFLSCNNLCMSSQSSSYRQGPCSPVKPPVPPPPCCTPGVYALQMPHTPCGPSTERDTTNV